ncbi:agmatinase family protein [soil metagenome]
MDTREQITQNFDADGVGIMGSLFGLPYTIENSELIILPVPWEVTVSYSSGTANGPKSILEASTQVDLFVDDIEEAWKLGLTMLPVSEEWKKESDRLREKSYLYIKWLEDGKPPFSDDEFNEIPENVNQASAKLNQWVKSQALKYLTDGKMVAVLGGDHSTPMGLIDALGEHYQDFGILQIDAHADLREAYEGFKFSHASIMYNALKCTHISKLVQVGVRDCSHTESHFIDQSEGKIVTFFDREIKEQLMEGRTWRKICRNIISKLPEHVYISFDIDGLDPKLCPHTGTPVPGGFDFFEIFYLIKLLVSSGRKIIGFDLCEVAPGETEWDGNVGARVLYRLSNLMAVSQGKLQFK